MKLESPLNVFFTLDKDYIIHFTVCLTSLLENNKDLDISVYVIHDIEDKNILENISTFFCMNYLIKLKLITLDSSIFKNLPISQYISQASYFRLLFADIIPSTVLSGLYLDCDTIVTGSLRELMDLNFYTKECDEEYSLLVVSDDNELKEVERFNRLGLDLYSYFNAGVMLLNLKKWRTNNVSNLLMEIAEKNKSNLKWHDQDVLNIYFQNKFGKLNPIYNKFASKKYPTLPIIIHFSGYSKPWHFVNSDPYKYIYWKYLALTPFKKEKFERITLKKILIKYGRIFKRFANLSL